MLFKKAIKPTTNRKQPAIVTCAKNKKKSTRPHKSARQSKEEIKFSLLFHIGQKQDQIRDDRGYIHIYIYIYL